MSVTLVNNNSGNGLPSSCSMSHRLFSDHGRPNQQCLSDKQINDVHFRLTALATSNLTKRNNKIYQNKFSNFSADSGTETEHTEY